MVWIPQKQLRDVDPRVWFPEAEGGVQKTVPEGQKVHTENIIQLPMWATRAQYHWGAPKGSLEHCSELPQGQVTRLLSYQISDIV